MGDNLYIRLMLQLTAAKVGVLRDIAGDTRRSFLPAHARQFTAQPSTQAAIGPELQRLSTMRMQLAFRDEYEYVCPSSLI